jgi:DNA-binding NarL/FixJ family response regulator
MVGNSRAPRIIFRLYIPEDKKQEPEAAAINIPEDLMESLPEALLVHSCEESAERLRSILSQHFTVLEARSCSEASIFLAQQNPPHLVLTSPEVPDGTWRDVLSLARAAAEPVSVVVVSPLADTRLYMETMEAGACDFITSSVPAPDVSYILKNAAESAGSHRSRHLEIVSRREVSSGEKFSSSRSQ